jgi:D-alanine-D-alanine ligase
VGDKITIVFGGPSAEHDISILTGLQCERVLAEAGDDVQCLYWDRGGVWHLTPPESEARDYLEGAPKDAVKVELRLVDGTVKCFRAGSMIKRETELGVVLLALHGGVGEGGGVQSLFTMMQVPTTGSTPAAAALGLDKLAFGALMEQAGVPTLPRRLVSERTQPDFGGPYIVKPRFGGSSIGIEIAQDYQTAVALRKSSPHLRAGGVIEPYRKDLFDLNVAFVTTPEFATSLIERPMRSQAGAIYDYAGKYMSSDGLAGAARELPAVIPDAVEAAIRDAAKVVQEVTGLSGVCRVDFLSDGEQVFVNEVNSIPGAMAFYLWPDLAPAEVLHGMVAEARRQLAQVASGSFENGAALRAAGGIAAKLTGFGPRASS